jgi:hypothetical protein
MVVKFTETAAHRLADPKMCSTYVTPSPWTKAARFYRSSVPSFRENENYLRAVLIPFHLQYSGQAPRYMCEITHTIAKSMAVGGPQNGRGHDHRLRCTVTLRSRDARNTVSYNLAVFIRIFLIPHPFHVPYRVNIAH